MLNVNFTGQGINFAASTNQFYIYRQCTYILFILRCQKVQKQVSNSLKIGEASVVIIIFYGVLKYISL